LKSFWEPLYKNNPSGSFVINYANFIRKVKEKPCFYSTYLIWLCDRSKGPGARAGDQMPLEFADE
jgi:hypothetical protein